MALKREEIDQAEHYEALFKFAMSLTRAESDAEELTQQTFYVWARKGMKPLPVRWGRNRLHRQKAPFVPIGYGPRVTCPGRSHPGRC